MSISKRQPDPTSSHIQSHSPDQPYFSLDLFYTELLAKQFNTSVEAISYCRDLCSSFGFTVKQEQSTHKNIYVYCSREGLPDSYRNPKTNPQRNRPSQRCECRWRIVLYESKGRWEFRKSQNSDAYIHNHSLMKPEEIKKDWPREVCEMIFSLARQRLPTHEIRQRVRDRHPTISWDDRRFYNRLSEERQKMKQRDIAARTSHLTNLSAQICMLNAGSEDLSRYVENKLRALLEDTCRFTNTKADSLSLPLPLSPQNTVPEDVKITCSSKKSFESLPKGYLAVTIPEYTFQVKIHHQYAAGDIRKAIHEQAIPRRRPRIEDEDLISPSRKLSKQGLEDELESLSSPSSPSGSQQNLVFPAPEPMSLHDPHLNSHHHLLPPAQPYSEAFDLSWPHSPHHATPTPTTANTIAPDFRSVSYVFPTMSVEQEPPKARYDPRFMGVDKRSVYPNHRPIMTFASSDLVVAQGLNCDPYLARRPPSFIPPQFRRSSGPN
ncbi:hypothetical protein BY458DRAFT_530514 [Sporodiniella umbellata]|nr:hypothetical protein BY458DRAFT_530514 [Sporodiniella umbellata]